MRVESLSNIPLEHLDQLTDCQRVSPILQKLALLPLHSNRLFTWANERMSNEGVASSKSRSTSGGVDARRGGDPNPIVEIEKAQAVEVVVELV